METLLHHHHHHESTHEPSPPPEQPREHLGSQDQHDLHEFHDVHDAHQLVPPQFVERAFAVAEVTESRAEQIIHFLITTYHLVEFEANKHPDLHLLAWIKLFLGLALCFFGGFFSSVVALVVAFRQGGGQVIATNVQKLHASVHPIRIRDQTGHIRTAMRVADPTLVQDSVRALYTATVSALMAIKLHRFVVVVVVPGGVADFFRRSGRLFTLGSSIGEHFDASAQKYVVPSMISHASSEAATWIPMAVHLVCRLAGVLVAWPAQRYLGILSTSVRGGRFILDAVDELLSARGVDLNLTQRLLDELLVGTIIAVGVAFQLTQVLPLFAKLVLAPALLVEHVLTTVITIV